MTNNSIRPINRNLSSATTPGRSASGSNDNEGVLHIPPNCSITGASFSNVLMSHLGRSLGVSYHFAEIEIGYSTASLNSNTVGVKNNTYIKLKLTGERLYTANLLNDGGDNYFIHYTNL